MTEQDLHIIELYLNGQLSGADKTAFETRLREDEEFKNTVVQMRATVRAVRESAFDEKMRMLKEEEKKIGSSQNTSFRITPIYRWVAVAAVFVAGFVLMRPLLKTDDTIRHAYLAKHFNEFVLHETTRGDSSDRKVTLEQDRAYSLYTLQKFHKAMPLLQELWEKDKDTLALYYLYISHSALSKSVNDDIIKYDNFGGTDLDSIFFQSKLNMK